MRQAEINGVKSSNIRYLHQGEKQKTRVLYEAAFPEDAKEFVDYYYEWKTKENKVIVMEGAGSDRAFHVMVHLNPYALNINGIVREVPYIVAVATDARYRRQGKMGRVMERALQDMGNKRIPFTFLLPADPAYYRGQGFVFFPCQDYLERGGVCFDADDRQNLLRAASLTPINDTKLEWKRAAEEDFDKMAAFSNRVLADRCGIFISRDKSYYRRLVKELAAEHGGVLILKEPPSKRGGILPEKPALENDRALPRGPGICGILSYSLGAAEEKTAEVKELLLPGGVSREEAGLICREAIAGFGHVADKVKFTSSQMMVRLTNLRALVPLLRSERRTVFSVKARDSFIEENNGCFRIELGRAGGSIREISEENAVRPVEIGELAQILFQHTSVYLNEWV